MNEASKKQALDTVPLFYCGCEMCQARKLKLQAQAIATWEASEKVTLKRVENRGKVGMEALPKPINEFWKGYWQAHIDIGQGKEE